MIEIKVSVAAVNVPVNAVVQTDSVNIPMNVKAEEERKTINVPMEVSASLADVTALVASNMAEVPVNIESNYVVGTGDIYTGKTDVTPILYNKQILSTRGKLMPDNVTVRPITILDVSNPYGGVTITIGAI